MAQTRKPDHTDHVRAVAADARAPATSLVAASWRRSLALHGLDPAEHRLPETLDAAGLAAHREAMGGLVSVAQPVLDRLFQSVGDAGCCVLLTDRHGVAIERRGAPNDDDTFQSWRLWPGGVWSEEREGTNGIGTCLAESRPLIIQRDQHFHSRNTGLTCIDAPIYDHVGQLAGALDVSSARRDMTPGMAGLIAGALAEAARTIETLNFNQAFPEARIVLAASADKAGVSLLAVDRHDLVVGATRQARLAFAITDERIAAQLPAGDLLSAAPASTAGDLVDAERGAIRRALARADGNVSAAARSLGISRATLHRKLNRLGLH